MSKLGSSFLLISLIVSQGVFSATQGTLGTTSTGTVGVSITIPALVQISGLSDITLGSTSSFPVTGSTTACVYSNVTAPAAGNYNVTASSANVLTGAFRVINGTTNFITYSAYWNSSAAATQTTSLTSGTKTATQANGSTTSLTCGGNPNANFNVSFSAGQVAGAPAGTYTDTVTLLITSS